MRGLAAILLALSLSTLAAVAQAATGADAARPVRITRPDWDRLPSGEDLARYYPEQAQRLELEGKATILCDVETTGLLRDCEVVSEVPADGEFGAAALKLAPLFRMKPATRDGAPVGGAKIRIPILFKLPEPSTAETDAEAVGKAVADDLAKLRRRRLTGEDLEALRQRTPKLHLPKLTMTRLETPWLMAALGVIGLVAVLAALGWVANRERNRPPDI
jgi:TonB family protein